MTDSKYLIHRHMRYEYPAPIDDLRHRLVVIPPRNHGDQQRVNYRLDVSDSAHEMTTGKDLFGNTIVHLSVARVEQAIDFDAWMVVRRSAKAGPHRVRTAARDARGWLDPSPLTAPDAALRNAAAKLGAPGEDPLTVAARISSWVCEAMFYQRGVTGVTTTAAQAFAIGGGVCQDYAHVMIALCRLCAVPARYVSGHLLGEGPMHAWVEVLVPTATEGESAVHAFDPTHDRPASLRYVTVAVGRDYSDVSPTRGTFRARTAGCLSSHESVSLTAVRYS